MDQDAIIQAIAVEEQIERYLKAQAGLGVRSEIPHAYVGYQATSARKAALQQLLKAADASDN